VIGRALLAAAVLTCGPLAAQERPPVSPAPDLSPPEARPLSRPADQTEAEVPPEQAEGEEAVSGTVFGPPPPPVWYSQAEDDGKFAACRLALSLLGTVYTTEPSVTDPENRDCGMARPIRVTQILPGVELTGQPLMRCGTARALGFWTRDFLRPAAALMPGAPRLTGLETGSGYTCRDRVGTGEAQPRPSEHGNGNAIDVMGFRFDAGEPLSIQPRTGDGDLSEAFQRTAQGTACLLFTTVLGPGSNAAHADHLHLDLAARNSDWRLCE